MVDAEEILDMVNHDVSEAAVDGECLEQVNHCFVQLSLCFYNTQREREALDYKLYSLQSIISTFSQFLALF